MTSRGQYEETWKQTKEGRPQEVNMKKRGNKLKKDDLKRSM